MVERDFTDVFCVVGGKGHLGDSQLSEILGHLNTTVRTGTSGTVHLLIDGYDDDERPLWEIPEVRDYIRHLVRGLDLEVVDRLDDLSRVLGAACCGMLRPIGKDPTTGNTIFERVP